MTRSAIRPDGPVVALVATSLAILGWLAAPAVGAFEVNHELALVMPAQNPFGASQPATERQPSLDDRGPRADDEDSPDGDEDDQDDDASYDDNNPVVI